MGSNRAYFDNIAFKKATRPLTRWLWILLTATLVVAGCEQPTKHFEDRRVAVPEAIAPEAEPSARAIAPRLAMHVLDTGAGECCVTKLPNGNFFIYDAGNYEPGPKAKTIQALKDLVPSGAIVELLVLSHTDSDHLGAVPAICERCHVRRIMYPELTRTAGTYSAAIDAIKKEAETDGAVLIRLRSNPPHPGEHYALGGAEATFVFGLNSPPPEWHLPEGEAEWLNAGSIVMRLEYAGKSILLCGDSVGRHIGDPDATCIAAERAMVENVASVPLHADVMVAPHHGADNGSSTAFIRAVNPTYVIFSAGHKFSHPRASTANRYLAAGISRDHMFRTDLGDDEGPKEWDYGRVAFNRDPAGDDNIDVTITGSGNLAVHYVPN